MPSTAYWDVDPDTEDVESLDSYYDYGSEIDSSRPAKGERSTI